MSKAANKAKTQPVKAVEKVVVTEEKAPVKKSMGEKVGLVLNPNFVKRSIKEYYAKRDIDYSKVSKGQFAIAAMLERLLKFLMDESKKTVGVNVSGLRELTREGLNNAIFRNKCNKGYFAVKADDYDEKFLFSKEVPMTPKEMDKILNTYPEISLTAEVKNYMYYLLYTCYTNVLITSAKLLDYSKKITIDSKCIVTAVAIEFPKQISMLLIESINATIELLGKDGDEDDDGEDDAVEEAPAEEPVVVTPKKNTNAKATTEKKTETKATTTKPKPNVAVIDENENNDDVEGMEEAPKVEAPKANRGRKPAAK